MENFFHAFSKLNCNDNIKREYEDVMVEKISASKSKKLVFIYCRKHQLLSYKKIQIMEKELYKQVFKRMGFRPQLRISYPELREEPLSGLLSRIEEDLKEEIRENDLVDGLEFCTEPFEAEGDSLYITCGDSFLTRKRCDGVKDFLHTVFLQRFGKEISVEFHFKEFERKKDTKPETYFVTLSRDEEKRNPDSQSAGDDAGTKSGDAASGKQGENGSGAAKAGKKPGQKSEQGSDRRSDHRSNRRSDRKSGSNFWRPANDPEVFYGKNCEGTVVPIKEIQDEIGEVVIDGQIRKVESREIKGEKLIVTFAVTDYTDTIVCKVFIKKEQVIDTDFFEFIKKGNFVRVKGVASLDSYDREIRIGGIMGIKEIKDFRVGRSDRAPVKRVELHAHTQMSDMDGITNVKQLVNRAHAWGHRAVAITDHGVVQAFPDANHALEGLKLSEEDEFKVIYGCEAYLVDDLNDLAVENEKGQLLTGDFVVFDLETTGFSPVNDRIIEIGAVRVSGGKICERYSTFVNPGIHIPERITELTTITDDMVKEAPPIETVLPEFLDFIGDNVLVAHNAGFDHGFIRAKAEEQGIQTDFTVVDTVGLARVLFPELAKFKLDSIAKKLKISLENHHRAVDDAGATAEIFEKFVEMLAKKEIHDLTKLSEFTTGSADIVKKKPSYHAIILAANETGRVNLYRLVSMGHLDYFYRRPRIPKSMFNQYREGLIIGSACEAGELYRSLLDDAPEERIRELVDFYDYLEIQPLGNNHFMIGSERVEKINSVEDLKEMNCQIVKLGEKYDKPVVATCDVHFLDPEDEIYRKIIFAGKKMKDADDQPPLYLRTTEEMLEEFSYLGEEKAYEVVVTNTNLIADRIEKMSPVYPDKCPPVIPDSDETLREICYNKATSMYGDPLPPQVKGRLDHELDSIIKNGFAVMYIIAQKLVWKSNEDGYLVGSRGSVGSSFVATMSGITEVNPLPAHYYCENCHYVDFESEEVKKYAGSSGCDMPPKLCPECGKPLIQDGHDIPFETFLGFYGDKEPDIDLNFSGEYQSKAHAYTEVIFGAGQTFRAGTIATLADKTAFGYVKNYYEERGDHKRVEEIERIIEGCVGIRRSTGQHPGGIIVLPFGWEIYTFTPVQHPANDQETPIVTTHFDYHSIDHNLLKLDILGHDDPTMIRMLEDLTGLDAKTISLDNKEVLSLFADTSALKVTPEELMGCDLGSLGIPEFGTEFVMQMLRDTKPKNFSDLVRISGLSHGTDVWLNNAQYFIKEGNCTLSTAICTRDDIMTYLIHTGVENGLAFKIMESVRKGKGLTPDMEKAMLEAGVEDWYIESCKRIKYMFPKAHAVAYVMMAFRIAYFKVFYPLAYYAAFFSIRAKAFDYELMCQGKEKLEALMRDYKRRSNELSKKEQDSLGDMKIVQEMYARGFEFMPIDIFRAKAADFQIIDGKLMPSLSSIDGMGGKAADGVVEAVKDGPFSSRENFKERCKIPGTVVDKMAEMGLLGELPETDQMSILDFFG
ncbi:MAG: PolC-type DNA polymerase III [Roseburia sp.]|nr:PolC-type DNA polymerase III [Roseburia sp.]